MQFLISTSNCCYSTTSGPSFKVTVTEGFFCNVFIKPVTNSLFNYHIPMNTTATSRQGKSTQERSCVGVCFIRWIRRSRPQINCMKALSRRPSPGLSISRKGISVSAIGLSQESHNAPFLYPTMHHFTTRMCTWVHISVKKWFTVGYLSDALWDLWDGSICLICWKLL